MKKLTTGIIVVLLYLPSYGQVGTEFPDSISLWNEYEFSDGGPANYRYKETGWLIYGDTLVHNKKCKKVYKVGYKYVDFDEIGQLNSHRGFEKTKSPQIDYCTKVFRKEGTKVYFTLLRYDFSFKHLDTGKEYLLFDFGWTKGDTIFSVFHQQGDSNYHIIAKDTTLNMPDGPIRLLSLEDNIDYFSLRSHNVIVGGMGFTNSIFFRLKPIPEFMSIKTQFTGSSFGVYKFCGDRGNYAISAVIEPVSYNCKNGFQWALTTPETYSKEIKIYPNPVSQFLFIENMPENATVQITDLLGRKILDINTVIANESINTTVLSDGMYILKVQSGNTIISTKFIKSE